MYIRISAVVIVFVDLFAFLFSIYKYIYLAVGSRNGKIQDRVNIENLTLGVIGVPTSR